MRFCSAIPFPSLQRIVPPIAIYRQTSFTVADWIAEHTPSTRYHTQWFGDELQAYCKTEETRTGRLYLSSFVVTPSFRGAGIGKAFLTSVMDAAHQRGYDRILLKVHEDNRAAQRLYYDAGFVARQKWNKRYEMERIV